MWAHVLSFFELLPGNTIAGSFGKCVLSFFYLPVYFQYLLPLYILTPVSERSSFCTFSTASGSVTVSYLF